MELPPSVAALPHGRINERGRKYFSKHETYLQERLVETMMLKFWTESQMARAVKQEFGINRQRLTMLVRRTRERWAEEDVEARPFNKAQSIRNVKRWIQTCENEGKMLLVARFHEQLMELEGTKEPLQVNLGIEVRETLSAVILNLTPDQINDHLSKYQETVRLAEHARALLNPPIPSLAATTPRGVVEVTSGPTPHPNGASGVGGR